MPAAVATVGHRPSAQRRREPGNAPALQAFSCNFQLRLPNPKTKQWSEDFDRLAQTMHSCSHPRQVPSSGSVQPGIHWQPSCLSTSRFNWHQWQDSKKRSHIHTVQQACHDQASKACCPKDTQWAAEEPPAVIEAPRSTWMHQNLPPWPFITIPFLSSPGQHHGWQLFTNRPPPPPCLTYSPQGVASWPAHARVVSCIRSSTVVVATQPSMPPS